MIFKNGSTSTPFQNKLLGGILARLESWVRFLEDKRRKGNFLSRILRILFEKKKIRVCFGVFLIIVVNLSSVWRGHEGVLGEGGEIPDLIGAKDKFEANSEIEKVVVGLEAGVRVPVEDYVVSRGYFWWHQGVDLAAEEGSGVFAFRGGHVIQVNYWSQSYGNNVILDHEDGYLSLYGHLKEGSIKVKVGEKVTTETILGEIGSTGYSTGPHLHFEILKDGELINPAELVNL